MRITTPFIRSAHGAGASAIERIEVPPVDEFPPPNAALTEQALAVREANGRPFRLGNRAASGRKPKLARLGVEVPETADPRYRNALRQARRYVTVRIRELAHECGGRVGAGPSAMLASSGLALAASRFIYALAAETGDAAMFKQGASLADSARQQELTAVALALRESQANVESDSDRTRRERLETSRVRKGT